MVLVAVVCLRAAVDGRASARVVGGIRATDGSRALVAVVFPLGAVGGRSIVAATVVGLRVAACGRDSRESVFAW